MAAATNNGGGYLVYAIDWSTSHMASHLYLLTELN